MMGIKFQEPNFVKDTIKSKVDKKIQQQLLADFLDLVERLIENLFNCESKSKSKSTTTKSNNEDKDEKEKSKLPSLSDFGWMVLHRCQLNFTNLILSTLYLIRLKQKHPTCKGAYGSGHRLFLASLILANKVLYDDAYHNHTWSEVSQIYSLDEVNRMEYELITFLNFDLTVNFKQWLELVDLLDTKLHLELLSVGCDDTKRGRLFESCGLELSEHIRGNSSDSDTDINDNSSLDGLNSNDQIEVDDEDYISDNSSTTMSIEIKINSPVGKIQFQPSNNTNETSGISFNGNNRQRQRRGSQLKYELINSKPNSKGKDPDTQSNCSSGTTMIIELATPTNLTTNFNVLGTPIKNNFYNNNTALKNGKPLPNLPLNFSNKLKNSNANSFINFNDRFKGLHDNNISYVRRKSLPAFPIQVNATTQVNFKVV